METADRWFSVDEIAKHLGVSRESIYRWIDRGKIPAHEIGRLWRFSTHEVNEAVRAGKLAEEHASQFQSYRGSSQ